ncbi:AAA family ATPase [Flavobacterium sp. PL002]|uniref:AAA family ATPase n=1 Tax=Flavobacterium sp. PL002 TaxID=1897058 RepID=UPI001787B8A1|nr:AAA family ATPase [Flavobacterium sp. PL002]MBE0392545.1 Stage V sporulation protein K [Flavobacterium sp. PL002]
MIPTTNYLQELEQEIRTILSFCKELNTDANFIQKINALVKADNSNNLLFKTEHFLVSDLITLYDKFSDIETRRSQFTLAYYYDGIRNGHFADKTKIDKLNELVASEVFSVHLNKIKNNNKILSEKLKRGTFILQILEESKHVLCERFQLFFQKFLLLSFNLKPDSEKIQSLGLSQTTNANDADTLEKVLQELNELIGLDNVKKDIAELINLLEIQKKRTAQGLKNTEITLHTVFLGPPGTGKTSVARLLSRIFNHLGFLSKGQLVETDREGLIAGYVGQTALKVDKVVMDSLGGVLFIDEAYALTQNSLGNDFGSEAVNTLIKRMEDNRDDLALIVAGYTEPMKTFVESNPGLRSRFNRFFEFNHFTPAELMQIFESIAKKSDFIISIDAKEKLTDTFVLLYENKEESFGNARVVRNLFEKCIQNQANRIIKIKKISKKTLKTLTEEDIPEPNETQNQVSFFYK